MPPFPVVLALFACLHITAASEGHPINCKHHNPKDVVVCEYKVNK